MKNLITRIQQLLCRHEYRTFHYDFTESPYAFYKCQKCGHIAYMYYIPEHINCRCSMYPYLKGGVKR